MDIDLKIEVNDLLRSVNADGMSRQEENELDAELANVEDVNELAMFVCKIRLEKMGTYRQFYILRSKLAKAGVEISASEPQKAEIKTRLFALGL